jgi:sialate O-acetylesterase
MTASHLQLARPFSEHMVLQAEKPLPIWGKAQPGREVVVRCGPVEARTQVCAGGDWRVKLPAFKASCTPLTFSVESEHEKIEFNDVLVGEVWLAAGQSNMDFHLSLAKTGGEALEKAEDANLRLLNLRRCGWRRWSSAKQALCPAEAMEEFDVERYFRGTWERSDPAAASDFSAVAYFFGEELRRRLRVPVGLIYTAVGGTPCEAWTRRRLLAEHPHLGDLVRGNWLENERINEGTRKWARQMIAEAPAKAPEDALGPNHCCKPGFCWEAGIQPLLPLGLRGVIWYQGESNSDKPETYATLFPAMIEDWREQFGQGDFPFLYVQLAAYKFGKNFPAIRQVQTDVLERLPNLGMAVALDVGDAKDIHPNRKEPVGRRLALWALHVAYGQNVVCSGPLFEFYERRKGSLTVHFQHAGGGLSTCDGLDPTGFEVADKDGTFHPATAKITGDIVTVFSEKVPDPVQVRYGWAGFPNPPLNLYNREGLPASPFAAAVRRCRVPATT